ncbi:MAG TPA: hypothetical protein VKU00_27080 [Chthonomonadaceae bacterium]|nr:hypothetical protein [Chthonomonadaceae bacterium]
MKLLCLWNERHLSRLAVAGRTLPEGSRLADHIRHCPDCRRMWQEFSLLTTALPAALADPLPMPRCSLPTLPARHTRRPVLRMSLATLAVSGLLLATWIGATYGVRPKGSGHPSAVVKVFGTPTPSPLAQAAAVQKGDPARPQPNAEKHSHAAPPCDCPPAESETALPKLATLEDAPIPRASTSNEVPEAISAEDWGKLGTLYAVNGDYADAADAYGRAYEAQPDPDLALAAGQSAESAGEVNEALAYYLHALETSTEPQLYPEEDEQWNEKLVMLSLECSSF